MTPHERGTTGVPESCGGRDADLPGAGGGRGAGARAGGLLGLIATLALIGYLGPLRGLARRAGLGDVAHPAGLRDLAPGTLGGTVIAVGAAVLLLLALIPRTAISLACGALFGAVPGACYAFLAALVAATVAFTVGRLLGRDFIATHASRRLAQVDGWLARVPGRAGRPPWQGRGPRLPGTLAVLLVRLVPIAPYGLVSYAYGTTGVRRRHYLAGTALGAVPSAVSYATLGAAATGGTHWYAWLPAAAGLAITTGALLYWRATRSTKPPPDPDGPGPTGLVAR